MPAPRLVNARGPQGRSPFCWALCCAAWTAPCDGSRSAAHASFSAGPRHEEGPQGRADATNDRHSYPARKGGLRDQPFVTARLGWTINNRVFGIGC